MAISKNKRKAIERNWVGESDTKRNHWGHSEGEALCGFLSTNGTRVLYNRFRHEVYSDCELFIDYYFDDGYNYEDRDDLAYLCRALTLNLLLNHEEKQP